MSMDLSKFNQVGVPYEKRYTDDNATLSKFVGAFSGLDKQDNGVEDRSIFKEENGRQELFKKIVEADAQDGVKGNIFAPEITRQLQQDYQKALNGSQEDIDKFMNKLTILEASDGEFDGDVFRNDVKNRQGQPVQDGSGNPIKQSLANGLKNSTSMKNFAEMLLQLDLADNNKYDGSIYTNKALMEYLDKTDNNKVDHSAQRFIDNVINPAGEQTPKYENMFAGYNLLNDRLHAIDQQIELLKRSATVQNNQVNPNSYYGSIHNYSTDKISPAVDASQIKGNSATGNQLAQAASGIASSRNTTGRCYAGVADALAKVGVNVSGASAYMAADQLAKSGKFKEIKVSPDQLKSLPAGAVVVWGKTNVSPHGHISVSLGDGREASDHIQNQMTSLRGHTNCRVFVPIDMAGGQPAAA